MKEIIEELEQLGDAVKNIVGEVNYIKDLFIDDSNHPLLDGKDRNSHKRIPSEMDRTMTQLLEQYVVLSNKK